MMQCYQQQKDILMDNVLSHMYYVYIISPLLKKKFGCTLFTINLYFNSSQYYPTLDNTLAITLSLHLICFIIRLYSCNINPYLVNLWFFVLHFVNKWDVLWSVNTTNGWNVYINASKITIREIMLFVIVPKATVHKSSPAPRDNRFNCSLNRHDITILLSYMHAHSHKSTANYNVSIPYK